MNNTYTKDSRFESSKSRERIKLVQSPIFLEESRASKHDAYLTCNTEKALFNPSIIKLSPNQQDKRLTISDILSLGNKEKVYTKSRGSIISVPLMEVVFNKNRMAEYVTTEQS